MNDASHGQRRPNYGIDAPGVVRNLALVGAAGFLLALVAYFFINPIAPGIAIALEHMGCWSGVFFLLSACVMIWGSKWGKFRERDRLLNAIPWRGDETVLDVGCGHGLLLIGAAKRLTTGKAVGVDLWQSEDQAGNSAEAAWENARLEGVAERIDIQTGDARQLPFGDASFDTLVSSWALHNIYDPEGRKKALCEIVRVLKPGGHVAILDIQHTREYANVLGENGLSDIKRSGPRFLFLIPTHAVAARKPAPVEPKPCKESGQPSSFSRDAESSERSAGPP